MLKRPYELVMRHSSWKKRYIFLLLTEIFWLTSFVIHEYVHSILFYIQTGSFGVIHFFDEVSYAYGTTAVTITPNTTMKVNTTSHELYTSSVQIIATAIFAMILWLRFFQTDVHDKMNTNES